MTKQQALDLVAVLEANKLGCDTVLRFDAAGNETWNVQLDLTQVYDGAEITKLANYCAGHGLNLTATFSALGVV